METVENTKWVNGSVILLFYVKWMKCDIFALTWIAITINKVTEYCFKRLKKLWSLSSYFWILWHKSLPNIRKWLQVIFLPKLLFVWPSNLPGGVQKTWSLVLIGHELVMRVYSSVISLRKYQLLPCQTHGAGVSSNETPHLPDIEDSCSSCTF